MNKIRMRAAAIALIGLVLLGGPTLAVQKEGETGNEQPALQSITGEVLKHEGESLIIKDPRGREIRLHIGKDTIIPGLPGARFKPGDMVEADVTTDAHVKSVRPVPQEKKRN
ncbi:MAG: hypothetical protein C4293_11555 [Nitrospiraceae bacterium]